jgi:hypothetical protein
MRAQRPVSDAHLAEAVRRGVITTDQMEALLALARSEAAPGGALPDLRWTAVVSALAATVAVLVPGLTMLMDGRAHDELGLAGGCAAALVACAFAGRIVRARGWGRAPAAILAAGIAPYAGGVAMFLTRLALGPIGTVMRIGRGYDRSEVTVIEARDFRSVALALVAATLVATGSAAVLWRVRRVGPALAVAGFFVPFVAMAAAQTVYPIEDMTPFRMVVVATALTSLAAAAMRPSWGRRDGVDGTAWWELGAFASVAVSGTAGFAHGLGGLAVWVPAALTVGALGLWTRRWTYQLAGVLGALWFLGLGLWSEPMVVRAAALVGVSVLIAGATQWHRRRDSRGVPESAALSYWE